MQQKKQDEPHSRASKYSSQSFQQFFVHLKRHINNHQVINQMCSKFNNELTQMSKKQLKNIQRGRYKDEYKKINSLPNSQNTEVKISLIKQVFYNSCQNRFKQFAQCRYEVRRKGPIQQAQDSKQGKKCQKQINGYVNCLQKLSRNIILSSSSVY